LSQEDIVFFSVVVPTYERLDDLRICLYSLSEKIQQGSPTYEIIVTDDSRSDQSRRMVEKEFPNVSWGKGKQNGPAGNRNAGVNRARGQWIVLLDDDCIAQDDYLSSYAKAIKANPDVLVFEGRIFADRPRRTWAEGCPENSSGGMLWTSNLCIRRKLFNQMGGLDEKFHVAFEDVDFAYRIKLKGIQTRFVTNAAVCHPWRSLRSGGKNWKKRGYAIESLYIFVEKHGINEKANLSLYFRYLIRTLSTDQWKSVIKFKCRGYSFLLSQIITILLSILLLIRFEWKEFTKRR